MALNFSAVGPFELVVLVGVVGVVVAWYFGGATNQSLSDAVWSAMQSTLQKQWASVPTGWEDLGTSSKRAFVSGRRYAMGAIVQLELKPRDSAINMLLALVGMGSANDLLTIDIPLREENTKTLVFAALPTQKAKMLAREATDLDALATPLAINTTRIPGAADIKGMKLYTDTPDVVPKLLPRSSCKQLAQHGGAKLSKEFSAADSAEAALQTATFDNPSGLLVMLHWTDMAPLNMAAASSLSRGALRFQFRVPPRAELVPALAPLLLWAFQCVDVMAAVSLPASIENKNKKARRALASTEATDGENANDRAAALKQKKLEERAAEIRRIARTNPDLAVKMETRDALLEQKRSARRRQK